MAKPLRIELPGAIYRVTSRGDGREPIVLGDDDREDLLIVLGQALRRFDARAPACRVLVGLVGLACQLYRVGAAGCDTGVHEGTENSVGKGTR